ncbi:FAD dependent oxidoreductase [Immersiella caudata]|uniref:FAD dependent oxidoreductase n=1 Tax=Immersiella caudata TaxID=314043 RepID=A0AA39X410_9PEZI|nr:FAD dependent oxidoreductase [Immersiella caudata]
MANMHALHSTSAGGGIIGCTTAYYLTRHPSYNPGLHSIILLEASSIAAAASGKAGGLLGLWAYPQCLVPLSYRLHRELAAEHGGAERWGYRRVECGQLSAIVKAPKVKPQPTQDKPAGDVQPGDTNGTSAPLPVQSTVADEPKLEGKEWEKLPKQDENAASLFQSSPLPQDLDWIDSTLVQEYDEMGQPGATETSQVHPFQFTNAIAELAREKGVDIRSGAKVTKISHTKTAVQSVSYEDRETSEPRVVDGVTDVIVAAGPWTGRILPRSRVEGLRAHSVVFNANVSPYAVFTDIQLPTDYVPEHRARMGQRRKHRGNVDPEIYARPGNEVYACGEPDSAAPLPETADLVQCDEAQCDDLIAYIGIVSPLLASAPIKAKQACYIPRHMRFGDERGPLIGQTSVPGIWIAAGHTCWGVQNGPATGYLMAELLFDGEAKSADIKQLDPKKFKV